MSFFEDNTEKIKMGSIGESIVRDQFKNAGYNYMQVDLIAYNGDKMYVCEVKTQAKFKAPPYDAHGLPPWQLKQRIEFSEKIGAIPYLIVYDIEDQVLYHKDMRVLISGTSTLTKNKNRILFPIESFSCTRLIKEE